tara:strand:+ start:190 stop:435 length:246 start_codon:yes stop_codon:yes gene_type:complete
MGKHRFNVDFVTFTRGEIEAMTSEDIQKNIVRVRREIREAKSMGRNTVSHEIEFCYLDNERQRREKYTFSPPKATYRGGRS